MTSSDTTVPSRKERRHHSPRAGTNVATFDTLPDAEDFKSILKEAGIEAWVQDERRLQRFWFIAPPQAGLHVRVPEDRFEETEEYLKTHLHTAALVSKAVQCPSCGSYRIEYPAMTRKNLLPTLVAQIAVGLGLQKHQCYCEACHYEWVRSSPGSARQP